MFLHHAVPGCAVAAALIGAALPALAGPGPIVHAPAGAAEGQAQGDLRVFRGLPYAQSTAGPARWTPPRPARRWRGVRKSIEFGPACYQPSTTSIYRDDPDRMS